MDSAVVIAVWWSVDWRLTTFSSMPGKRARQAGAVARTISSTAGKAATVRRCGAAVATAPASVHMHAGDAMVELTLTPGRAGPVRASMHLMGAGLSPLEPREVTLALSNPEAGIEPIRRSAVRSGQGVWEVDGLLLLPAGNWSARVDLLVTDFERRTIEATVELR